MKIKLLFKLAVIICLGFGSVGYGDVGFGDILCAALRTSQAYEKGDISDKELEEFYHRWKDGLNKYFREDYDTEDPIATYEDFKIIFGLGKKRIQLSCPMGNEADCNNQFRQKRVELNKEIKIAKKILNTDAKTIELLLDETEDLWSGILWVYSIYLHYFGCDANLDKVVETFSLALENNKDSKIKDL